MSWLSTAPCITITSSPRKPEIQGIFCSPSSCVCHLLPPTEGRYWKVLQVILRSYRRRLKYSSSSSSFKYSRSVLSATVYMCKQLKPSSLSSKFVRDSIVIIIKNLKIMSSWYDVKAVFKSSWLPVIVQCFANNLDPGGGLSSKKPPSLTKSDRWTHHKTQQPHIVPSSSSFTLGVGCFFTEGDTIKPATTFVISSEGCLSSHRDRG